MIWKLVEAIACIIECIILSNFIIHYFPVKIIAQKLQFIFRYLAF